jgi:hypothetical protein
MAGAVIKKQARVCPGLRHLRSRDVPELPEPPRHLAMAESVRERKHAENRPLPPRATGECFSGHRPLLLQVQFAWRFELVRVHADGACFAVALHLNVNRTRVLRNIDQVYDDAPDPFLLLVRKERGREEMCNEYHDDERERDNGAVLCHLVLQQNVRLLAGSWLRTIRASFHWAQ